MALDAFVVFSAIIILAFALGLSGLWLGAAYARRRHPDEVFADEQWNTFFGYSQPWMVPLLGYFSMAKVNLWDFDGAAIFVMLIYLFICSKVLTSMIMAIFAGAHAKVFANSEVESLYRDCCRVYEYRHIHTSAPPPLNAPILLHRAWTRWPASADATSLDFVSDEARMEAIAAQKSDRLYLEKYLAELKQKKEGNVELLVGSLQASLDAIRTQLGEEQERSAGQSDRLARIESHITGWLAETRQPLSHTSQKPHSDLLSA